MAKEGNEGPYFYVEHTSDLTDRALVIEFEDQFGAGVFLARNVEIEAPDTNSKNVEYTFKKGIPYEEIEPNTTREWRDFGKGMRRIYVKMGSTSDKLRIRAW